MLRLIAALIVPVALAPVSAHATDYTVRVADFSFSPKTVVARAGDRVGWTWVSGTHDVTAYANATFASGLRTNGTFSFEYTGGTVLYRCTPHSSLGAGTPPTCLGMCGRITDDREPLEPPQITTPQPGTETRATVPVSGSGTGARIDVREGTRTLGSAVPEDGAWSVQLTFPGGSHTIIAVVVDGGTESAASAPVSFAVDAEPPSIEMTQPTDLSPVLNPLTITGTASDDRQVAAVSVTLRDRLLSTERILAASCEGCGSGSVTWRTEAALPPGIYGLHATATDGAGNATSTAPITILVA